jgi:mRNA interferase YafQ
MRTINRTNRFKRDYKREQRTNSRLDSQLMPIIALLTENAELPERLCDHALSGKWKGCRECHVRPDLLLIYSTSPEALTLIRLGSHAELFG